MEYLYTQWINMVWPFNLLPKHYKNYLMDLYASTSMFLCWNVVNICTYAKTCYNYTHHLFFTDYMDPYLSLWFVVMLQLGKVEIKTPSSCIYVIGHIILSLTFIIFLNPMPYALLSYHWFPYPPVLLLTSKNIPHYLLMNWIQVHNKYFVGACIFNQPFLVIF